MKRPLAQLLALLGLLASMSAEGKPPRCDYGLVPTGFKALWVPRQAKEARIRAVAAAQRLRGSVTEESPMAGVLPELAALLLLAEPVISPAPDWKIVARNGSLLPLRGEGVIRRDKDGLRVSFASGADLSLNLGGIWFQGRLGSLSLGWQNGHPRLSLEFLQLVDVSRLHMRAERACLFIELRLDEP